VIDFIISELTKDKDILGAYGNLCDLKFGLISTGTYRKYDKGKICYLVFGRNDKPLFFIKHYKVSQMNPMIEDEYKKQLFLYNSYQGLKIPKPLALININGINVSVEEAHSGASLYKILSESVSRDNVIKAINYASKIQIALNRNLLLSDSSNLGKEVNNLTYGFFKVYNPSEREENFIQKCISSYVDQFRNQAVYTRFSNGDFVSKNIILSPDDNSLSLIDFEFIEQTHLYYLDWFRFFTYYFPIEPPAFASLVNYNFEDPFINKVMLSCANLNNFASEPSAAAMWILFNMKDFIIKCHVFPSHQIIKEREILASKLAEVSSYPSKAPEINVEINNNLIQELSKGLESRNSLIKELSKGLESSDSRIKELETNITEETYQINQLTHSLQAKDTQIKTLEADLAKKENDLSLLQIQIQQSITLRLQAKYQKIIEKLFRPGTRRRYYYELMLNGTRIILNEGWRVFLRKVKLWYRTRKITFIAASDRSAYIEKPLLDDTPQIDIIVPVYNAFYWTEKCLNAVLSFTVNIPYRIILVDDGSTDLRLLEYLAYMQSRHKNIVVLHNSENVGFLKTINKGMKFSSNDVLLLNTDAIVTYNWLSKLRACAYSNDKIATVTPLSNNATICSVPEFCKNNEIPPGYSIQEYGELVENTSRKLGVSFYKIPVGIGFCMYIKRHVISEIGLFNEEFNRGYEEEVDFCLVASKKGYFHVACPQVFVYHAGTASTNTEQAQLSESKNWNTLVRRHPHYPNMLTDFTTRNPLSNIQTAIRNSIKTRPDKPLNIGIDAQLLTRNIWTGSERYIAGLIDGLVNTDKKNRYNIYTANVKLDKYYYQNSKFLRKYASDSSDILWDADFSNIDVFHRTFQCYSAFDMLLLLNARTSVLSLLDLISYHHPNYFTNVQDYKRYQKITQITAQIADRIIAISEHAKKDISENLHVNSEKISVVYPGILDTSKFKRIEDSNILTDFKAKYKITKPYILYIGTTFPHKNHEGLLSAYEYLLNNIGSNYSPVPDLILIAPDTHLHTKKIIESKITNIKDKVKLLDYVPDEDVPLFYNCASLFVFPSLYEGFGLPLLEAMACEIPVVASKATSIPEVTGDAAILVDCKQPNQLADALYLTLTDMGIRKDLVEKGKKRIQLFSKEEMIKKTLEVYNFAYKTSCNNRQKIPSNIAMELKLLIQEDNAHLFINNEKL
jgi:glycosyltransferase involved in cell wall biosynthesis/GT2 family glycosyltransferase